jgi:hypothetical protein
MKFMSPIDFVSLKDEVVAGKATPQVAEAHHRSPNQNSFESTYAIKAIRKKKKKEICVSQKKKA